MPAVAIVAEDGSILEVVMAEADDPVLAERFPGTVAVKVPGNMPVDKSWRYEDRGFFSLNGPSERTNRVDF
jgi:hypothetical protein